MLKEISSQGHLKMSRLDTDKSVGMCDKSIMSIYHKELSKLSNRFNEKIVWGLSPYEGQKEGEVIYFMHSYPVYLGGLLQTEHSYSINHKRGIKLGPDNLLRLCDSIVAIKLTLRDKTYEMICGILAMDNHKRRSLSIPQIWIREEDTSIPEEALDWISYYIIKDGYSPIVVSRHKMYTPASIIACGVYYKGD